MTDFFVHCDWGSSRFRLKLVEFDDVRPRCEFISDEGVAQIAGQSDTDSRAERFRTVMERGLERLTAKVGRLGARAPVLISGMAGSSIGWREVPYATVPWRLDGSDMICRELEPIRERRVVLLSGVRTHTDVMRGEETQAIGLLRSKAKQAVGARTVVVLPGTHSKHLRIEDDAIVDFQTYMTGELFEVLSEHSILRHSVDEMPDSGGFSAELRAPFQEGVRQATQQPLAAALFRVRTRHVLGGRRLPTNRAFLSGLLIGSELAPLSLLPAEVRIVLCATAPLAEQYVLAADSLGLRERVHAVPPAEVERLSALGQALMARHLWLV